MRVERIDRWVWVVLSLAIGVCLAWARSNDQGDLQTRLGWGVADQSWFEREVLRRVPTADDYFVRGSNWLFFDGHVDLLTRAEAIGPRAQGWGTRAP